MSLISVLGTSRQVDLYEFYRVNSMTADSQGYTEKPVLKTEQNNKNTNVL